MFPYDNKGSALYTQDEAYQISSFYHLLLHTVI